MEPSGLTIDGRLPKVLFWPTEFDIGKRRGNDMQSRS